MALKRRFSFYSELLVNSCIINLLFMVYVSEFMCSFPSPPENNKLDEALLSLVLSLAPVHTSLS